MCLFVGLGEEWRGFQRCAWDGLHGESFREAAMATRKPHGLRQRNLPIERNTGTNNKSQTKLAAVQPATTPPPRVSTVLDRNWRGIWQRRGRRGTVAQRAELGSRISSNTMSSTVRGTEAGSAPSFTGVHLLLACSHKSCTNGQSLVWPHFLAVG